MIKRISIGIIFVLLIAFTVFPSFAASIDGEQSYMIAVRTPVTLLNFTSAGNNTFPVVDILTGVRFIADGDLYIDLYSGGYEDDYDPEYLDTLRLPIYTGTGTTAPVTRVSTSEFGYWQPTVWEGRYWQLSGAGGRLTVTYNPEGYPYQTAGGTEIYYKCWTEQNGSFGQGTQITSYDLIYNAPNWEADHNTVQISPDYSPNGNDSLYFEAMKNAGWYSLTLHCRTADGVQADVHFEWLAFAGDYSNTMSGYLTQTIAPDINTGASYDYGYTQGFQAGKNSMQSAVNDAYSSGFSAGVEASDGSGGIISSAIFALGDIPFNMIFDIMDMEILGINLASLVSMAITGACLIFIIKTFLI